MFSPVVKALWGHYRRHSIQIVLMWLGLTLGIALLVGVMAVNQQAKVSYRQGEQLFSNPFPYRIRSTDANQGIPQGFYIQLRRSGFNQCVPLVMDRIETQSGQKLKLIGIDPISLIGVTTHLDAEGQGSLTQLMRPPYPVMVGQSLADYMGFTNGEMLPLSNDRSIGPIKVVSNEEVGGAKMIADISLLRQLRPSMELTAIICGKLSPETQAKLRQNLPPTLTLERDHSEKLEPLTEAFHLNLFAMGLLSFVIGLFIFYQAISLSLSQRQRLVGILRQLGASNRELSQILSIELFVWVILGVIGGNGLGLLLAHQLMPSVAATLNDLYGAHINPELSWQWQWGLTSFVIALIGAILSCGWPLVRLIRTPPIHLSLHTTLVSSTGREFAWQALFAVLFLLVALGLYQFPHDHTVGFSIIALVLVAAGLLMPFLMWWLFHGLARCIPSMRGRWLFTDAAASLTFRGVAAMAFMLALSSNIGMETMVGSFRQSTETWLEQRLSADLYVRPTVNLTPKISKWLEQQPEVSQVWWQWRKKIETPKGDLQVVSIGDSEGEKDGLSMKLSLPYYWQDIHDSRSVLVSESLSLRNKWSLGQEVTLPLPLGAKWKVAGIYYDYGNPYGQILISTPNWKQLWPKEGDVGLAIHLTSSKFSKLILREIGQRFHLSPERVKNNSDLLKRAMKVFDRTFVVTDTLSKLTLLVAICGLFVATLSGEDSRLRQFALLRCLGLTGRELVILGGGQLLVIGIVTAMMALPLGILLAKFLIDIILKHSFGWTMPIYYFPSAYITTLVSALVVLLIAGAWPVWRLVKRSAMRSLRGSF